MKRVLALVTLLGVLGVVVGCGGGSTAKNEQPGAAPVVRGKSVEGLKEPAQPKGVE